MTMIAQSGNLLDRGPAFESLLQVQRCRRLPPRTQFAAREVVIGPRDMHTAREMMNDATVTTTATEQKITPPTKISL